MKRLIKTQGAALALTVALLSTTPVVAQQGVESTSMGDTSIDTRRDDGMDWGWLGLLGLAGLAGLRRKDDHTSTVRPSSAVR